MSSLEYLTRNTQVLSAIILISIFIQLTSLNKKIIQQVLIILQDPRKFKKSLIKKFEMCFEPEVSDADLIACF